MERSTSHSIAALIGAVLLFSVCDARAERRCGWLENPTPGNWWVSDKEGRWVLAVQGRPETKGMDRVPDISARDYVATSGAYGYGCACVDARFGKNRVAAEITGVRQLPLAACKRDRSLPEPGL